MFTGIVRDRGRVLADDGVCLTVVGAEDGCLAFDVVPETRSRIAGFPSEVNVEPAVRAGEPLGGHYVQGHVDGIGRVRAVEREGDGRRMWIETDPALLRYCVEKGSIALAGVSLTIAELDDDAFAVALVPHTLAATTIGALEPGASVNLEVDVLAKYVEQLIPAG